FSLQDVRIGTLFQSLQQYQLENGTDACSRINNVLYDHQSKLCKKLDALVWDFLVETNKFPEILIQLEIEEEVEMHRLTMQALRELARLYAEQITKVINWDDRVTQPDCVRQTAMSEMLKQGDNCLLLAQAQMLCDDATICRPVTHTATHN
ncbi:hypothetical protein KDA14_05215, partial [Candidatus Saccharibacteria bacterium]|nr:hypothetical protein [Candidatus Saccharibacteria bacterium]